MRYFILIFLGISHLVSLAQDPTNTDKSKSLRFCEVHLSIALNGTIGRTANDISDAMIESGFGDTSYDLFTGEPIKHPFSKNLLGYDVELSYFFKKTAGISFNMGLINRFSVSGYDNQGQIIGEYLFLDGMLSTYSLSYIYRTVNERHSFFAGPCLVNHTLTVVDPLKPINQSELKPGIFLGYEVYPVLKSFWAVVLRCNYRWTPKSEIGPIYIEGSEFKKSVATMSSFNFAAGVILRFSY